MSGRIGAIPLGMSSVGSVHGGNDQVGPERA